MEHRPTETRHTDRAAKSIRHIFFLAVEFLRFVAHSKWGVGKLFRGIEGDVPCEAGESYQGPGLLIEVKRQYHCERALHFLIELPRTIQSCFNDVSNVPEIGLEAAWKIHGQGALEGELVLPTLYFDLAS